MSNKLYLDVGNDDCNILCNFGERIVSGYKVMKGGVRGCPPSNRKQKTIPGLNRVLIETLGDKIERNKRFARVNRGHF